MTIPAKYKISESGSEQANTRVFRGRIVYEIPEDYVEAYRSDFTPSPSLLWPGKVSLTTPWLHEYDLRPSFDRPGYQRLELIYQTPTWGQIIEQEAGRAMLEIDVSATSTELVREVGGSERVIVGVDDTAPNCRWKLVGGSNVVPQAQCSMRLTATVADPLPLGTYLGYIGKTNNATLSNFGNVAIGTLLYMGARTSRIIGATKLWSVQHIFLYDSNGWPTTCSVRKFVQAAVECDKWKLSGTTMAKVSPTETELITVEWPTDVAEDRNLPISSADFSALNTLLEWNA